MATRTLKVEFISAGASEFEVSSTPQVHDISIDAGVTGVPTVLENPHVDFPGSWTLQGEGEGGTYRYARSSAVANTSGTAAG